MNKYAQCTYIKHNKLWYLSQCKTHDLYIATLYYFVACIVDFQVACMYIASSVYFNGTPSIHGKFYMPVHHYIITRLTHEAKDNQRPGPCPALAAYP